MTEEVPTINTFRGDFAFLSNFYPSTIYVNGIKFKTVEHAYVYNKATCDEHRNLILEAKTPGEAKKIGRMIPIRKDWEEVKVGIMKDLIRLKFQNPFLRQMLLATGNAKIIHENYWHDKFWGIYKGEGENWLGKLLMEIREEIKLEEIADVAEQADAVDSKSTVH